jgi:DNA-binding transcriptional MerR regulator
MKTNRKNPVRALQAFEPETNTVYTLEAVEHIAHVPRRTILRYYKHGLVSPALDPNDGGYCFDGETIRTLQRIEHLRAHCGMNLAGVKMILDLMSEVERLRSGTQFLRE